MNSKLTAGVLAAAAECLPRKKTPSLRGGMRTRPRTQWHPDATWHKLKQRAQESWQEHKDTPQDHADALLNKRTYRQACRDLRIHTSQSRTRWLSQRLHNTSLHAPSHTVKFTWEKLKRSLGSESISGLPAQVRGGDGRVLQGQEARYIRQSQKTHLPLKTTAQSRSSIPSVSSMRTSCVIELSHTWKPARSYPQVKEGPAGPWDAKKWSTRLYQRPAIAKKH